MWIESCESSEAESSLLTWKTFCVGFGFGLVPFAADVCSWRKLLCEDDMIGEDGPGEEGFSRCASSGLFGYEDGTSAGLSVSGEIKPGVSTEKCS